MITGQVTAKDMQRALPQPGFWLAVVLCVLVVGLQMVLSTPLGVIDIVAQGAGFKPPNLTQHPLCLAIINLLAFAGAIVLGLALNRIKPSQAFSWVRVRILAWVGCLLSVVGAVILASELDNFVRWILPPPEWINEMMEQLLLREGQLISRFFLLVIVAPVTEELLFRGIIFRGLMTHYRFPLALLFSSLMFAGVHLNPWQFSSAFLLGIMVAWFYFRTGSIALCVFAHAVMNGAVLIATSLPYEIPGVNMLDADIGLQLQPVWLDAAGVLLLISGIVAFVLSTSGTDLDSDDVPMVAPPIIEAQSTPTNSDSSSPEDGSAPSSSETAWRT